jgi:hypothetical protein
VVDSLETIEATPPVALSGVAREGCVLTFVRADAIRRVALMARLNLALGLTPFVSSLLQTPTQVHALWFLPATQCCFRRRSAHRLSFEWALPLRRRSSLRPRDRQRSIFLRTVPAIRMRHFVETTSPNRAFEPTLVSGAVRRGAAQRVR